MKIPEGSDEEGWETRGERCWLAQCVGPKTDHKLVKLTECACDAVYSQTNRKCLMVSWACAYDPWLPTKTNNKFNSNFNNLLE